LALRIIETRQLLYIISMFLIVQFLGLLVASQVFPGVAFSPSSPLQMNSSFSGGLAYLALIIIMIFVFSLILALMFKFRRPVQAPRSDRFFMLFEIFIVGYTTYLLALLVIIAVSKTSVVNVLLEGNPSPGALGLALLCALLVTAAKLKWPSLRNVTAIIVSVGAGLVFGMFFGLVLSFWLALVFMALLAVYDVISVFVTKHMVTLANAAVGNNLSLMIMANEIEAVPMSYLGSAEQKEYLKAKKEAVSKGPISSAVISSGMVPVPARTALGTGDLMASLMLAVSAYTVDLNFTLSFVVVLGSVLGLFLTMYVLKKYKRPLPAIPFLLFGILVALGIFSIIPKPF
jgi:presenilin-like A22 family membrane protease